MNTKTVRVRADKRPQTYRLDLTRKNHDRLLELDRALLQSLFDCSTSHDWSFYGVRFYEVPESLITRVEQVLS